MDCWPSSSADGLIALCRWQAWLPPPSLLLHLQMHDCDGRFSRLESFGDFGVILIRDEAGRRRREVVD